MAFLSWSRSSAKTARTRWNRGVSVIGTTRRFRNEASVSPADVQDGDAFAIKIVAVARFDGDWSAYVGPSDWPDLRVADAGTKIDAVTAKALFYVLAMSGRGFRQYPRAHDDVSGGGIVPECTQVKARLSCSTAKVSIMPENVRNESQSRSRRYECGSYNLGVDITRRIMSWGFGFMFAAIGHDSRNHLLNLRLGCYVLQLWWHKRGFIDDIQAIRSPAHVSPSRHKVGFWD